MTMPLRSGPLLRCRVREPVRSPRRLLLLLHGVGADETQLEPLAIAAPDDAVVVLARAPLTFGEGRFGRFDVRFAADGPRPDLAAAESSRVLLADFVTAIQAEFAVPAARTVIAGFSQGGIMSASGGLTQPDVLSGFGVMAGRILPEIESRIAGRSALAHLRAFVCHGQDDSKLPVEWAHRANALLETLGVSCEAHLNSGGHELLPSMQSRFLTWFARTTADEVDTI